MAQVVCDYCSLIVDDKNIPKQLALQINKGFVRYRCPECQKIISVTKALEDELLESSTLQDVPDELFINILRMRGYSGTLKKSKLILI